MNTSKPMNFAAAWLRGGGCRAATTADRAAGTGVCGISVAWTIHGAAVPRRYLSQCDKFHLALFCIVALATFAVRAAETNALPALAPPYGELPPTFLERHQSTIIVVGFAVFAFAFFFLKVMLRPKNPKSLPPEIVARQALARLQNEPEDGTTLSAASHILRRYVSKTFDLTNNELTTAEFCAAVQSNQQLGAELAETIASFLKECDVRKFSPPTAPSPVKAVQRALELVEKTEKHLASTSQTRSPALPSPSPSK